LRKFRSSWLFDLEKIRELEVLSGRDLDLRLFYPLLSVPVFLLFYNPLLSLASFFLVLQLPKLVLWFCVKKRKEKIARELPSVSYTFSWLSPIYPIPVAISKIEGGETGKIFRKVREKYARGEPLERALEELDRFDELSELKELLLHVYRTGRGKKMLESFAKRKAGEYRAKLRERGAKLQLYSTAFVVVSTVFPSIFSSFAVFSGIEPSPFIPALISAGVWLIWKIQE